MKKLFILQKISMIVYVVAVLSTFLYSLYFMTAYANLAGFELPLNEDLRVFHDETMQRFNFVIFYFSVIGAISVLALFVLQVNKKICDKLSLITSVSFSTVATVGSIIAIAMIPGLITAYNAEGLFDFASLETVFGYEHTMTNTPFYVGIAVYVITLISSIFFTTTIIINHVKFLSSDKEENIQKLEEVGV